VLGLTVACLGFSCLALGFTIGIRASAPDAHYDPFPDTGHETPLKIHGILVITSDETARKRPMDVNAIAPWGGSPELPDRRERKI